MKPKWYLESIFIFFSQKEFFAQKNWYITPIQNAYLTNINEFYLKLFFWHNEYLMRYKKNQFDSAVQTTPPPNTGLSAPIMPENQDQWGKLNITNECLKYVYLKWE
jgi:hypothetical protein